ncbi:hypothetical protein BH11PLA2_BH11PLA2_27240 [soil metagenome]
MDEIPIPIPYARDYTATMSGTDFKFVVCEGCSGEYVYQLQRVASGSGTSYLFLDNKGASLRAEARARAQLKQSLAHAIEIVPCPTCGLIQKHMVPKARRNYRRGLYNAGMILIIIGIAVGVIGGMKIAIDAERYGEGWISTAMWWTLTGMVCLIGIALLVVRWRMTSRYDPNRLPLEDRLALGQDLAYTRVEFEKLAAAAEQKANKHKGKKPAQAKAAPVEEANPLAFEDPGEAARRRAWESYTQ